LTANRPVNLDPKVLTGVKNLMLRARTVVEGALVGEHISPFRGGSVEFAQHRAYSPGDDTRYIDWRLFARTDHIYVKQFEVTTNLRAYILLDGSGSMAYGGEERVSKHRYAGILAGALAYVLAQQGDAVSLSVNRNEEVSFLPPRSQTAYLQQLLRIIDEAEPDGDQDIVQLLQFVQERVNRRSLIAMFSDFFVDLDSLMSKIRILKSRGHDLLVFQILDPDELEFPFNRFYRFESMEDARNLTADARSIRAHYLEALHEHQTQLQQAMRKQGVDYQLARTDTSPDRALSRCLNGPMRARKLRKMY